VPRVLAIAPSRSRTLEKASLGPMGRDDIEMMRPFRAPSLRVQFIILPSYFLDPSAFLIPAFFLKTFDRMKYVPRRSSSACAQSISQAPHHSWGSFGVEIALPEPDNLPNTTT